MNQEMIERIQTIINHYSLTVSSFADKIGVQRSSVSHILNGRNRPSLDFVMKVVHSYPEVNLYWLLNGKGSFPHLEQTPNPPSLGIPPIPEKEHMELRKMESDGKKVEASRIVIFYTDGTFETFELKK
nr:helix-turn-helix transcriptional regulator [Flagellimonas hymeniacidonis]